MRKAKLKRQTSETDVSLELNIDGSGIYSVETDVPFLTHMIELFSKHGLFDVKLVAHGDVDVDPHHLIEDVGITLGACFKNALGDKRGINRYGFFSLPMDETLVSTAIDLSGRSYFVYNGFPKFVSLNGIEFDNLREFWKSFAFSLACNLHLNLHYGLNLHHMAEATFKCVSRALRMAVKHSGGLDVPSTKGVI